jgi:hypothetical protein
LISEVFLLIGKEAESFRSSLGLTRESASASRVEAPESTEKRPLDLIPGGGEKEIVDVEARPDFFADLEVETVEGMNDGVDGFGIVPGRVSAFSGILLIDFPGDFFSFAGGVSENPVDSELTRSLSDRLGVREVPLPDEEIEDGVTVFLRTTVFDRGVAGEDCND